LGSEPLLIGIVGEDDAARRLREVLHEVGISEGGLLSDPTRSTTLKTRIIAHSQQVVRADRESRKDIPRTIEKLTSEKVASAVDRASALVLSDYSKGALTTRIVAECIRLARRRKIPILVDPKLARFGAYKKASLVTPNIHEAERVTGAPISDLPGLARAARAILTKLGCQAVLVTRGDEGMSLFEKGKPPVHIDAAAREVFDVTGAGDTVIATIAFAISGGASLAESARLANQAAGIVVGKLGTAAVDPQELLDSLSDGSDGRR
jgi:D-beta-D-heptose 7-phosphate kinase/D-beta-D-heptose 1-phosphate adenosyltransferase